MDEGRRISIDELRSNLEALRNSVEVANAAAKPLGLEVVILKPSADAPAEEDSTDEPKPRRKPKNGRRKKKRR